MRTIQHLIEQNKLLVVFAILAIVNLSGCSDNGEVVPPGSTGVPGPTFAGGDDLCLCTSTSWDTCQSSSIPEGILYQDFYCLEDFAQYDADAGQKVCWYSWSASPPSRLFIYPSLISVPVTGPDVPEWLSFSFVGNEPGGPVRVFITDLQINTTLEVESIQVRNTCP